MVVETASSVSARQDDDEGNWEPEFTEERFVALLICNRCNDPVSVAGTTRVDQLPPDGEYGTVLRPTFVHPAPHLLRRPNAAPQELSRLLTRCEELFWSDFAGCSNAVRVVIEAILTHQKVPRYRTTKGGKRTPIPLHQRITSFGQKEPDLAEKMLAVKWVGNAGSHDGAAPKRNDLFDCFDLLEHVIEEVYEKRSAYLSRLAKEITRARGPLSAKKRRKK